MSQAAVEKALGKLITDECFRDRFFKDPAGASFYAGLELSRGELDALSRLPKKALADFSTWLDDRICRLLVDEDQRPAPADVNDSEEGVGNESQVITLAEEDRAALPCRACGHDRQPE